jgi:hypothetical protein
MTIDPQLISSFATLITAVATLIAALRPRR